MTEVVYIMEYMADQLAEHPYLFLGHFMGHLNILSQIVQLHVSRKDFTAICTKFTSILCKVIPIKNLPTQFLYDLLEKWLQCLEQIPCDSKCCVYQTIECDLRWALNCFLPLRFMSFIKHFIQIFVQTKLLSLLGRRPMLFDANANAGRHLLVLVRWTDKRQWLESQIIRVSQEFQRCRWRFQRWRLSQCGG